MNPRWLAVGLMSGTSCDGIDASLVEIVVSRSRIRAAERMGATLAYRRSLRAALLGAAEGGLGARDLATLHFELGTELARATRRILSRAGVSASSVDFVGSHGHTVYHGPRDQVPNTLQIGQPASIAEATGISVVADFRAADVAAGGEGAPLTPHANRLLFMHPRRARSIHNLGGISNLSVMRRGRIVTAFDTGPANMLIDAVARTKSNGLLAYDRDGALARRGRVDALLVDEALVHPYFRRRPPKSTGRETFGDRYAAWFLSRASARRLSAADSVATATAITAASIEQAYRRFVLPRANVDEIFFSGGGARNPALFDMLTERLDFARVSTVDELGVSADRLEAVSFAVLGLQALRGVSADLRLVTGARHPVILGSVTPGRNWRRLQRRLAGGA
jgi:anhydro-N-acetylmuramic acid kinase